MQKVEQMDAAGKKRAISLSISAAWTLAFTNQVSWLTLIDDPSFV